MFRRDHLRRRVIQQIHDAFRLGSQAAAARTRLVQIGTIEQQYWWFAAAHELVLTFGLLDMYPPGRFLEPEPGKSVLSIGLMRLRQHYDAPPPRGWVVKNGP